MAESLITFQNRLTNLNSRNRCLFLPKLYKNAYLDFKNLDYNTDKSAYELLEKIFVQNKTITIGSVNDPRSEKSNELSSDLKKIYRTQEIILEERGSNSLYIGFPMLKGKFIDGSIIKAPLIFLPVQLQAKNNNWQLIPSESGPFFNQSLLLAYSHFHETKIDQNFIETSFEDFPQEFKSFKTALYELLKESDLEINFNQELFIDEINKFREETKEDLKFKEKNGELKLYPEAVLGIFQQSGSYLNNDYEYLLNLSPVPTLESLYQPEVERKEGIKEEDLLLPYPADSSQEIAIRKIKEGQSLVIEGPPGTGKSQMICNLLSDYAAKGKKVLLICQKKAALETVYRRLEQKDLSPFVGMIHDVKKGLKEFYQKIEFQIENIDHYQKVNQTADSILMDRDFRTISRKIEQILSELEDLKQSLFDTNNIGKSIRELYLDINPDTKIHDSLNVNFKNLSYQDFENFLDKYEKIISYSERIFESDEKRDFWMTNAKFTIIPEKSAIKYGLEQLANFYKKLEQVKRNFGLKDLSPNFILKLDLEELKLLLEESENGFLSENNYRNSTNKQTTKRNLKEIENQILEIKNSINYELLIQEFNSNDGNFEKLEIALTQLKKIKQFPYFGNEFLFKTINGQKINKSTAFISNWENLKLIDLYNKIEHTYNTLKSIKGVPGIEIEESQVKFGLNSTIEKINLKKQAQVLHEKFSKSELGKIYSSLDETQYVKLLKELIELKKFSDKFFAENGNLFTKNQFLNYSSIFDSILEGFDTYLEIAFLINSLNSDEKSLLDSVNKLGAVPRKEIEETYKRYWIEKLEEKKPILRSVSSGKIEILEKELQENLIKKENLSLKILKQHLYESTYKDLEFNRLGNQTSYRDLKHQVSKKRQLWPIRKLLHNYFDEISNLVPIFLASPETVSSLFEMEKGLFDLIIFDEASQCFAEEGIPALYRAKQLVVVGDSKQLQPFDLYKIKIDNEDEDDLDSETSSFLELSRRYLEDYQLLGHYRSKRPELIAFSNTYFYKDKLQLLPEYNEIRKNSSPIEYHKVQGVWKNNSNEEEAKKVIEILETIPSNKSVGVVCFNSKQTNLINSLYETSGLDHKYVQIKNIENVQGDEFDVLLFSIAYAPTRTGEMRMNFGTLNNAGGENRLNVAISRAKEKVMVVTSILPHQLKVDNSLNQGPKFLKMYMEFALECSENKYEAKPYKARDNYGKTLKDRILNSKPHSLNQEYKDILPFSDLAITNLGRVESLIYTDDSLYFEQSSAKETHGLLPIKLREKGWSFKRYWSRNLEF